MKDYSTIIDVEMGHVGVPNDFEDSFIESASWPDGTPLTYEELDEIPSDIVYDWAVNYYY